MITRQLMVRVPNLEKGRLLFAENGCVLCHSVGGVGGTDASPLDAALMERMTDPFDFVASIWRGAPEMLRLQQEELGGSVEFTGEELGDISGFLLSAEEQKKFSVKDFPARIRASLSKMDNGLSDGNQSTGMKDMKTEGPATGETP